MEHGVVFACSRSWWWPIGRRQSGDGAGSCEGSGRAAVRVKSAAGRRRHFRAAIRVRAAVRMAIDGEGEGVGCVV